MRRAIAVNAAWLFVLGACGTDDRASGSGAGDYATGDLPTADTVQRESDVREPDGSESDDAEPDMHVASKEREAAEDESAR